MIMRSRRRYEYRFCKAYSEMRDRMEEKAKAEREEKAKQRENVYIPHRAAAIGVYK